MTFHEQLIITIVDKLAIGMIIILVGFLVNAILERFKSKQALISELAKIRTERLSEVWELLYEQEALLRKAMVTILLYRLQLVEGVKNRKIYSKEDFQRIISEALSYIKSSKELAEKFENSMEKNRFWIGQKMFLKCRQHKNMLEDFTLIFSNTFPEDEDLNIERLTENLKKFNANLIKLNSNRIDIEKSLKYIR